MGYRVCAPQPMLHSCSTPSVEEKGNFIYPEQHCITVAIFISDMGFAILVCENRGVTSHQKIK